MGNNKKYLKVILSLVIALAPVFTINSANASTIAGWNITSQIAQGASTIINATKSGIENGVNVVKNSTAKITPSVSNVSKVLRGGAYGYAISIALEQMLGFTVDWILDPANNQIKYYVDGQPLWFSVDTGKEYASRDAACSAAQMFKYGRTYTITRYTNQDNWYYCYFSYNGSEGYVTVQLKPTSQEERKIPLDAVSTQVISNAESHPDEQKKVGSQAVTTAAAQDMLANDAATQSDVETQLNENAKTQTSEDVTGTSKPNELNPDIIDISLKFPEACKWFPLGCQAANVVINFPNTLTDWWNRSTLALTEAYTFAKTKVQEASDYFKEETNQDTELNIQDETQQEPDTTINFASTCPDKIPIMLEWNGRTIDFSFDFSIWCNATSTFLKPVVIALGSLHALYIVAGIRQDG